MNAEHEFFKIEADALARAKALYAERLAAAATEYRALLARRGRVDEDEADAVASRIEELAYSLGRSHAIVADAVTVGRWLDDQMQAAAVDDLRAECGRLARLRDALDAKALAAKRDEIDAAYLATWQALADAEDAAARLGPDAVYATMFESWATGRTAADIVAARDRDRARNEAARQPAPDRARPVH